jgi:hypothetical protein
MLYLGILYHHAEAGPMISVVAAFAFLVLTAVTIAFQLALAVGAPWGGLTWGGRFTGTLPISMRFVATLSALLLTVFAVIVATRAGLLSLAWAPVRGSLIWAVVVYCVLGVLANAATSSQWERRIWLPVVLLMLGSSLLVALTT